VQVEPQTVAESQSQPATDPADVTLAPLPLDATSTPPAWILVVHPQRTRAAAAVLAAAPLAKALAHTIDRTAAHRASRPVATERRQAPRRTLVVSLPTLAPAAAGAPGAGGGGAGGSGTAAALAVWLLFGLPGLAVLRRPTSVRRLRTRVDEIRNRPG
jgi:hypothetical protein